jgi:hypothetical protein
MPLLALLAQGATLCILFLFLFLFNINQNEGFDRHSKSQNPSLGFSTRFDGSSRSSSVALTLLPDYLQATASFLTRQGQQTLYLLHLVFP